MSLFCQKTNPNCDGDQAISLLSSIYGQDFINAFINATGPASTVPTTGLLTNILLGGVASVAISLVLVFAVAISLTALLRSAQDGEAFGKDAKKTTIVSRLLYSIIMLLPTASGYCFIQVVAIGMSLWSNNVANTINNRTTGEALVASAGLADTKDKNRDIYGFRENAPVILRQLHCVHVLNKEFYNLPPETGRWSWGTAYNLNPKPGISKVQTEAKKTYIDKTKANSNNWTQYSFSYVLGDRYLEMGGLQEPICGSISVSVANPIAVENELSQIPLYKIRQKDQQKINVALGTLQAKIQKSRINMYNAFFDDIDRWYVAYDVKADATESEGSFPISKPAMDAFNTIVDNYISKSHEEVSGILTSDNGYSAVQQVVSSINQRGWMMAPEARIKVSQFQSAVQGYITQPLHTLSPPTLNSTILSNSKGEAVHNTTMVAMDNAVGSLTTNEKWVAAGDIRNSKNLVSFSADGGESSKLQNIDNKFATYWSTWATNISKTLVMYVLVGSQGDNSVMDTSQTNTTPQRMYRDTNIIRNIQDAGEFILTAKSVAQASILGLKIAVIGVKAGKISVTWIPGFGKSADAAVEVLEYTVENLIAPVLAKLISALTVIGLWMAVIIPYMPMIFFGLACVGWLVHLLYAICGLPLWALMHMIPERTFVGSQTQGYVTILTLFMRPIFIVVGYWMAEITIGPALIFVTDMFFSFQGTMSLAYSSTAFSAIYTELITFVYKFGVYLFVVTSVMYLIYGLVFSVADQVQQWIGSGLNGGQWGESNSKEALGKIGGAATAAGAPTMGGGRFPRSNMQQKGTKGSEGTSGSGATSYNSSSKPVNMPVKTAGTHGNTTTTGRTNSGSPTSPGMGNTQAGMGGIGQGQKTGNNPTSAMGMGTASGINVGGGAGTTYGMNTTKPTAATFNKSNVGTTTSFGNVGVQGGAGNTYSTNSKPESASATNERPAGRSGLANKVRSGVSSAFNRFKRK